MAASTALLLLAAAAAAGGTLPAPAPEHTRASASARAVVRSLPGVKVSLSDRAEAQGHRLSNARVTVEDGQQLLAKLVEFQ
jgi:hypothetical protein